MNAPVGFCSRYQAWKAATVRSFDKPGAQGNTVILGSKNTNRKHVVRNPPLGLRLRIGVVSIAVSNGKKTIKKS